MAQVNGQDLGNAGRPECLKFIGAQRLHGLKRPHIDGLDALVQHLGHDAEGENGDGNRAGEGAQREDQRAHQRDDQRGQGTDQRQNEAENADDHRVAVDVGGSENCHRHGDGAADDRAQNGHLDGVQQGADDLGEELPVGMENLFQQVQHLGKPADDDREIKAGHFQRPHDGQR